MLVAGLLTACGGAAPRPAPTSGPWPLSVPGLRMHHQVALDLPDRSEVLVGHVRFDGPGHYALHAQTPFGLDLFELRRDAQGYHAEVAEPLRGRFPADALAREIARIYLFPCVSSPCQTPDGDGLEELRDARGAVTRRVLTSPSGRRVQVDYLDYGWAADRWLAHRIRLSPGEPGYRVEIVLTSAELSAP